MRNTATTLTTGSSFGRWMAESTQIGTVCDAGAGGEVRDDDLVERQREREQAAGQQRGPHAGQRDRGGTSATCPRRGRPTPPRATAPARRSRAIDVVVDETTQNVAWPMMIVNSPSGMPKRGERRAQRHAGDDARQRDRQDDQEARSPRARRTRSAATASAASVPSTSAMSVAPSAAAIEVRNAPQDRAVRERLAEPVEREARRSARPEMPLALNA